MERNRAPQTERETPRKNLIASQAPPARALEEIIQQPKEPIPLHRHKAANRTIASPGRPQTIRHRDRVVKEIRAIPKPILKIKTRTSRPLRKAKTDRAANPAKPRRK